VGKAGQNFLNLEHGQNHVKFILSHHCCDIICRKTKYPIVIFSPQLQLSLIFKLTQICWGRRSWPNFFEPGTWSKSSEIHSFSSLLGHYLEKIKIPLRDFFTKVRTEFDLQTYSDMLCSAELTKFFSSAVQSQNELENDYLTSLFRKYLEENKIPVSEFCSIVTNELDLQY
jgi:hypothetical protein